MHTIDKSSVASSVAQAERSLGDAPRGTIVWFHLAVALIRAICEVADALYQVAADLPSHDH